MKCIEVIKLNAEPMTAEAAKAKGLEPRVNDGDGYLLTTIDGTPFWVSKEAFDKDFVVVDDEHMTFGRAVEVLKEGHCVRRDGWNDEDMFVVKQIPCVIQGLIIDKIQSLPQSCKDILKEREGVPHIDYNNQVLLVHSDGKADSWTASSADIFANDWRIVK